MTETGTALSGKPPLTVQAAVPKPASERVQDEWNKKFSEKVLPDEPDKFIVENLHYLKEMNCKNVLDLGSGTGRDAIFLAKKGFTVTAVDFSEEGNKIARERIERNNCTQSVSLLSDDFTKMELGTESYDCVLANKSLYYFALDQFQGLVRKILAALRPGGIFVMRTYSIEDPQYRVGKKLEDKMYDAGDHPRRFYTKTELQDILYNFNVITLRKDVSTNLLGKYQVMWAVIAQKPFH
ncbi:MAG TPA: class I SAM-dependent methyltransferase [archaeon]|nr:class I SAM-dependent methyltransferase [archaeon]